MRRIISLYKFNNHERHVKPSFTSPHAYLKRNVPVNLPFYFINNAIPISLLGVFHWVQALEAIALIFSLLATGIVTWYLCGPCPFRIRLCQSFFATAGVLHVSEIQSSTTSQEHPG